MNICESKYCFCFEYLMIKLLCVSNSPCNFLKTTEILFCSSNFGRRICMFPIVLFISFGFAKLVETYILVASAKTNETKWASNPFLSFNKPQTLVQLNFPLHIWYLQTVVTQCFVNNKSEIWS